MIKKTIIILFFIWIITPTESLFAAEVKTTRDSLKLKLIHELNISKKGDTTRLKIYDRLSKLVNDTESQIYYIDRLLEEAKEQNNNKYICKAYLANLVLAYNTFDVEGVNKWYSLLEPVARKEKLYDMLFSGRRGMVDMFNTTGDYEREEKEALKMLEEAQALNNDIGIIAAYQCLSHAYRATFRIKEAAEILEKGYNHALKADRESSVFEINNLLISTYNSLNDKANILKWTKNFDTILTKKIAEKPSQKAKLKGWMFLTYLAYLSYYTDEEDFPNAYKYLILAEEYKITGYAVYENYYHTARSIYFSRAKMYNEALIEIDKVINLYKNLSPVSYAKMNFEKAFILEQLGKLDSALALYNRSFFLIDSIQVSTLNKQTELLKKDYDTEQLLLKKQKMQSNIRFLFLIIIIITVVILISFVIHAYYITKKLQKSEVQMRKMAEEMEQANIAKDLFLSNISTSISSPLNSVVEGSLQLAFDKVQDIDERKKISQALNETSAKLLELINSILDLSRLEAKMMKFKLEEVEIIPFVQGITALLSSDKKMIQLDLPTTDNKLSVNVDQSRLQEVLKNSLVADKEPLKLSLQVSNDAKYIQIEITGTQIAQKEDAPQEVIITNEVNRLLIEHFGGQYFIKHNQDNPTPAICFTLPLV